MSAAIAAGVLLPTVAASAAQAVTVQRAASTSVGVAPTPPPTPPVPPPPGGAATAPDVPSQGAATPESPAPTATPPAPAPPGGVAVPGSPSSSLVPPPLTAPIPGPPGGVAAPPEAPAQTPASNDTAPTDGLRRLANAMSIKTRSVTVQVSFPRLDGTTPTEISIGFAGPRQTQDYRFYAGNRFVHSFPVADGRPQRAYVSVTLRELTPEGKRYSVDTFVDLEPLYDVVLGELILSQTGDGPHVFTGNPFHAPPAPGASDPRLLPGATRRVDEASKETGDQPYGISDCSGLFSYRLTITLRTFPSI